MRIEGSDAALAALGEAASRIGAARPMFDEIGTRLVGSTQQRFEDEAGPDGSPWPRSIRAQFDGGKTLTDSKYLRKSFAHEAGDDRVAVGTTAVYAAIHQFGGTIRAKTARGLRFRVAGGFVSKQSVTIPARPFLGLSDTDERLVLKIAADHVARAFGGDDAG
ncbi:MAG: phage virion morphogenesis protein [Rhizobiaceae bacterium]